MYQWKRGWQVLRLLRNRSQPRRLGSGYNSGFADSQWFCGFGGT
jgi:hypothetical protein